MQALLIFDTHILGVWPARKTYVGRLGVTMSVFFNIYVPRKNNVKWPSVPYKRVIIIDTVHRLTNKKNIEINKK